MAILVVAVTIFGVCSTLFVQAYVAENEATATDSTFFDSATGMRTRHVPTIDENFCDDSVLVTLKREYSAINNTFSAKQLESAVSEVKSREIKSRGIHTESDTSSDEDIKFTQVEDLTHFTSSAEAQFRAEKRSFAQILEVKLDEPSKENVLKAIEYLEKLPFVLAAEPVYNYIAEVDWVPNDARYGEQWGLNGTHGIQAELAWEFTRGNAEVRVGVMDSGFDITHEDLVGNSLVLAGGFVPAAGTDIDHGTHCAGIIGAVSNNRVTGSNVNAVAGISQSSLVRLNSASFVNGMTFARNNNIRVISASFRYIDDNNGRIDGVWPPAGAQVNHANAVRDFPSLLVASAGNSGNTRFANTDNTPQFPAGYGDARNYPNITNVISVGNITSTGARAAGSCFGQNSVHVYAPGNAILSTLPGNTYDSMSGTSMAAPHVAGVAALLYSANTNLTAVQVRNAILNNADSITIQVRIADNNNNFIRNVNQDVLRLNAHRAVASVALTTSAVSGGVSITGFVNGFTLPNNANISIPDKLNGQAVVAIGASAFANKTSLTQITIPASVTNIDSSAFENCTCLTNVTLPNSLTTIGSYSFNGCSSLSSIIIPSSVTQIGYRTFQNCSNLKIYITGMTCVPNGWNYYWNPSNRPIYFNGIPHTHDNDGREFTGNHYHGIKKNHHYEYRYYCTQCKFTFGIDYEIEICSGPPCSTLYNLPYLSDIDHFEGDSHHDDLQNSLHNQIVKYLPTKKKIY